MNLGAFLSGTQRLKALPKNNNNSQMIFFLSENKCMLQSEQR